jgi:hypothetical protein
LALHLSHQLERVIDKLQTRWHVLSDRRFVLGLAHLVLDVSNGLLLNDLVVGSPVTQLSLQNVELVASLLLDPCNLLLLAFLPDLIQIGEQRIDKVKRKFVAMLLPKLVRQLKCGVWNPLPVVMGRLVLNPDRVTTLWLFATRIAHIAARIFNHPGELFEFRRLLEHP